MLKTHSFLSTFVGMTKKLLFQEKNQETNQEKYSRKNKEKIEKKLRKKKNGKKSRKIKLEKNVRKKKEKISKIKYGVHFLRVKIILGQKLTLKSPA